jgi:hypothetical protein
MLLASFNVRVMHRKPGNLFARTMDSSRGGLAGSLMRECNVGALALACHTESVGELASPRSLDKPAADKAIERLNRVVGVEFGAGICGGRSNLKL